MYWFSINSSFRFVFILRFTIFRVNDELSFNGNIAAKDLIVEGSVAAKEVFLL